jgi:4'-phosphopantetheinyl transferase
MMDALQRSGAVSVDEVTVWYCWTAALDTSELDSLDATLSQDECARRDRFVLADDRRDFTVAHGLLRRALSHHSHVSPKAWRFERSADGKPSVVPSQRGHPPIAFNLSHTRGLVACAVAHGARVGIDAERIDRVSGTSHIPAGCFSPAETLMLTSCASNEYRTLLIELWTLKESYVKAVGTGIDASLQSFGFVFDSASDLRLDGVPERERWHFLLASIAADARIAIAVDDGVACGRWRLRFREVPQMHPNDPKPLRWSAQSFSG